jgi:hypothetical protein
VGPMSHYSATRLQVMATRLQVDRPNPRTHLQRARVGTRPARDASWTQGRVAAAICSDFRDDRNDLFSGATSQQPTRARNGGAAGGCRFGPLACAGFEPIRPRLSGAGQRHVWNECWAQHGRPRPDIKPATRQIHSDSATVCAAGTASVRSRVYDIACVDRHP